MLKLPQFEKKWKILTFCGQFWLFRKTRSAILAEFISGFLNFFIVNVGRQLCNLPENLKKIGAKMRPWECRVDQKVGLLCRHFWFSAILTKNDEDKRQNIDILLFSRPESVESDAKIAPIWKKLKKKSLLAASFDFFGKRVPPF